MTEKDVIVDIKEIRKPEIDAQLGRRKCCPAAGETYRLSAGHEEIRDQCFEVRSQRHPNRHRRPSRRRGNGETGMVPGRSESLCIRLGLISIMDSPKHPPPTE